MKNNIVLIGMPGVGKSSAGVVLAKAMGYHFVDSDIVIQHKEGRLLSDIIEECGNDGFLKIEDRINSELEADKTVIATGGSVIYGKKQWNTLKKLELWYILKQNLPQLMKGCPISKDVALQLKKDRHLKTYMMKDAYYTKNMQI